MSYIFLFQEQTCLDRRRRTTPAPRQPLNFLWYKRQISLIFAKIVNLLGASPRNPHQELCPWTPLGDFLMAPPFTKSWIRHCVMNQRLNTAICADEAIVCPIRPITYLLSGTAKQRLEAFFTLALRYRAGLAPAWVRRGSMINSTPRFVETAEFDDDVIPPTKLRWNPPAAR